MSEPASLNHEAAGGDHLTVRDLSAWYGQSHVLHEVSFDVRRGEVITLLGRNGAGKTTILKSLIGMLQTRTGSIRVDGVETVGKPMRKIARMGIGYVPEDRGIYATLSVEENLLLPPRLNDGGYSVEKVLEMFPNLAERRRSQGTKLSGGEQQMLAIGRILRTGAKLLLLDEPTEGLAPVIVQQIGRAITEMRNSGFTVVLVEQNFHFASKLADRHYVVEQGKVVDQLEASELEANAERLNRYLGV